MTTVLRSVAVAAVVGLCLSSSAAAAPAGPAGAQRVVAGLRGGSGSTVGPDGALYVTESEAGRVSRVDPRTGRVTAFAGGLPPSVIGLGGAMDVAFLGRTAYVLVTLVGPDVGGNAVVGVYRVDGPHRVTVVADIGAWATAHPPASAFSVPTGVQYAIQSYRGGFLVTDGHHNRVLRVEPSGRIREVVAFGNVVPTGLAVRGRTVFLAQAGPLPHRPADGTVVSFRPGQPARPVASGAPLLVDVEVDRSLYALAQGRWPVGGPEGSPARPDTGQLLRADRRGVLHVVADRLDRPTSFELIRGAAYVVTLDGEVWRIRRI